MSAPDRPDREAESRIASLRDEVEALRGRLADSPRRHSDLEARLTEAGSKIDSLTTRNTKLLETLKDARQQLLVLREEVDRLAQPPSGYGVFLTANDDDTVDVFTSGRRMRLGHLSHGRGGVAAAWAERAAQRGTDRRRGRPLRAGR